MKFTKYDKPMMETAYVWAKESYCKRNQVGSVLSKDGRIVSIGYNGTISGAKNECESNCPECNGRGIVLDQPEPRFSHETKIVKTKKCSRCGGTGLVSKNTVVHAEANALMFAAKNGIETEGCTLYVTLSPCIECSKMIIQAGIKDVVYGEDYRITHGVEFLKENGVNVRQYDDDYLSWDK